MVYLLCKILHFVSDSPESWRILNNLSSVKASKIIVTIGNSVCSLNQSSMSWNRRQQYFSPSMVRFKVGNIYKVILSYLNSCGIKWFLKHPSDKPHPFYYFFPLVVYFYTLYWWDNLAFSTNKGLLVETLVGPILAARLLAGCLFLAHRKPWKLSVPAAGGLERTTDSHWKSTPCLACHGGFSCGDRCSPPREVGIHTDSGHSRDGIINQHSQFTKAQVQSLGYFKSSSLRNPTKHSLIWLKTLACIFIGGLFIGVLS